MPKTAEEVLTGLLSTSYNLDEQGVAALKEADGSFKDEAIDHLNGITAERIKQMREAADKERAASYSRGLKETMEKFERDLRDEYELKDSKSTGKALVAEAVAKRLNGAGITDEAKIKAHPLYIALEAKVESMPKTIEEAVKAKEAELQGVFKAERDTARIVERGKAKFKAMNPILPKNEAVAQAQMSLLEQYIKGHKFQLVEDNGDVKDVIPMKPDGSGRLENSLGVQVTFDKFIEEGAKKYFEFRDEDDRSGAPDPNKTGNSSGTGSGGDVAYNPTTVSEYARIHAEIYESDLDIGEKQKRYAALKEAGKRSGVAK